MSFSTPSTEPPAGNAAERFAELFREHGRAIYGHVRALVPHASDADEVFQETSVTLWRKFDQYQPHTDFRAWACRIAYYKVLKLRDRRARSPRLFSPEFLDLVSEELIVMSDVLDARTEALRRCREKLNRRDSELLERFHREGGTAAEVARWARRNVHYVYRSLRRIHDALYDCIKGIMDAEKRTGPFYAEHPKGSFGKLDLSPFPPPDKEGRP